MVFVLVIIGAISAEGTPPRNTLVPTPIKVAHYASWEQCNEAGGYLGASFVWRCVPSNIHAIIR